MKLQKAIVDLQARVAGEFAIKGKDNCEDMKLGIEALKRLEHERSLHTYPAYKLLPGETKE